jgi:heat shock protein HslJ
MMRRMHVMTFAIATLLLAGCGSDSSTAPTQASVAGTWNLSTINGSPLPFTLQAANPKIEYLNEQLIVSASGTFTQTANARFTINGAVTTQAIADAGTYVLNGTAVTFRFNSDGSSGTGTVSGNTLTVAEAGFSEVYTKQ